MNYSYIPTPFNKSNFNQWDIGDIRVVHTWEKITIDGTPITTSNFYNTKQFLAPDIDLESKADRLAAFNLVKSLSDTIKSRFIPAGFSTGSIQFGQSTASVGFRVQKDGKLGYNVEVYQIGQTAIPAVAVKETAGSIPLFVDEKGQTTDVYHKTLRRGMAHTDYINLQNGASVQYEFTTPIKIAYVVISTKNTTGNSRPDLDVVVNYEDGTVGNGLIAQSYGTGLCFDRTKRVSSFTITYNAKAGLTYSAYMMERATGELSAIDYAAVQTTSFADVVPLDYIQIMEDSSSDADTLSQAVDMSTRYGATTTLVAASLLTSAHVVTNVLTDASIGFGVKPNVTTVPINLKVKAGEKAVSVQYVDIVLDGSPENKAALTGMTRFTIATRQFNDSVNTYNVAKDINVTVSNLPDGDLKVRVVLQTTDIPLDTDRIAITISRTSSTAISATAGFVVKSVKVFGV